MIPEKYLSIVAGQEENLAAFKEKVEIVNGGALTGLEYKLGLQFDHIGIYSMNSIDDLLTYLLKDMVNIHLKGDAKYFSVLIAIQVLILLNH